MRHKNPSSSPPPSRFRRGAAAVAVVLGLMAIYSCSLLVETRDTQCQADSDCAMLAAGSKCDPTTHACLSPTSSSSSGTASSSSGTASSSSGTTSSSSGSSCDVDGGIAGGGCYNCAPTDNATLLNHCTTGCVSFDNKRVKNLAADGGLPSLPNPGPDGGM